MLTVRFDDGSVRRLSKRKLVLALVGLLEANRSRAGCIQLFTTLMFFDTFFTTGPVLQIFKAGTTGWDSVQSCTFTLETDEHWCATSLLKQHDNYALCVTNNCIGMLSDSELTLLQDQIKRKLDCLVGAFINSIRLIPRHYDVRKRFEKLASSHAELLDILSQTPPQLPFSIHRTIYERDTWYRPTLHGYFLERRESEISGVKGRD